MPSANTNSDSQHEAINLHSVEFLLSAEGRTAAGQLGAVDGESLRAELAHLRRPFTPEQAGALVALARLRRRATDKFPAAGNLFFTATSLEQATAYPVAAHHAAHLDQNTPPGPILDL